MNVNMKYYRVFIQVYETRSMSLAAFKMNLSQPTVSRIIHELEKHYGTTLFYRNKGRLIATESGKKFYDFARQFAIVDSRLDQVMREQKSSVLIGATPHVAAYYLPDLIAAYQKECDELDIQISVLSPRKLNGMLCVSQLDFAIVEGQKYSNDLETEAIFEDEMIAVYTVRPRTGEKIPLYIYHTDVENKELLMKDLKRTGISYEVKGTFIDVHSLKQYISRGMGVGIIPKRTVFPKEQLNILDSVHLWTKQVVSMVWPQNKSASPNVLHLMQWIKAGLSERNRS